MSRAKRLAVVLELADKAERKAAEACELAQRLLREDQQKMADLQHYYDDYECRFAKPSPLLRAQDVAQQRGFLQQLSTAIAQQRQVTEQRNALVASRQAVWQQARLKRRALVELIERIKGDEQKRMSRKEEQMLDEWFAQTRQHRGEPHMG